MKRIALLLCLSLVAATAAGCRKTSFGAGCEKAVDLTAPWTELGVPLDEDKTRVCASSAEELKLRSYVWSSAGEAQPVFENLLVAAGYSKDRCTGGACWYKKAGTSVGVHPMEFKVKKSTLVTVVLTSRPNSR